MNYNETPLLSDDDGEERSFSWAFNHAAQACPSNTALLDDAWALDGHQCGSSQRSSE